MVLNGNLTKTACRLVELSITSCTEGLYSVPGTDSVTSVISLILSPVFTGHNDWDSSFA